MLGMRDDKASSLFDGFEFPYEAAFGGASASGLDIVGDPANIAGASAVTEATEGEPEQLGEGGTGSVSGNPGATNILTGTGALGRLLGFGADSGVRLGGAWLGDANWLMSGGLQPGKWSFNDLGLLSLLLDFDKLIGLKGGMFGIEFLQFAGQPTTNQAGLVQGYNSLIAAPPLVRQELYEMWWRQELFDGKLIVRLGKSVPTYDFNNVVRPVPTSDPALQIPAVSGLIYTPIFVNSSMLGAIPGYYNSATGITATFVPNKNFYFSYGGYDGNRGNGEQTGLRGPQFNGYYFHIWEAGSAWVLGSQRKPGNIGLGFWDQTGKLTAANLARVNGANGFYLFGAQRLWFRNPGRDNSGVSGFYQFGANNSNAMLARQYFGAGLTGFGLIPSRPKDSMGCGMAWAWLNTDPNAGQFFFPGVPSTSTALRSNELMLQSYYQQYLRDGAYFQPVISYIPNPGERPGIPPAWAMTLQLLLLF